jgi:hypothetical protein
MNLLSQGTRILPAAIQNLTLFLFFFGSPEPSVWSTAATTMASSTTISPLCSFSAPSSHNEIGMHVQAHCTNIWFCPRTMQRKTLQLLCLPAQCRRRSSSSHAAPKLHQFRTSSGDATLKLQCFSSIFFADYLKRVLSAAPPHT